MNHIPPCRLSGFTLIELLVVIAILASLMSLVILAAGRSLESARRTACASNLRQIATASLLFTTENNGRILATPFGEDNLYWFRQIYPYLKNDQTNKATRIFQCPEDRSALNAFRSGGSEWDSISYLFLKEDPDWELLGQITSPSQSPQFIDAEITATGNYRDPVRFERAVKGNHSVWRHRDGVNVAFWDGSVTFVREPSYEKLFHAPNQR